jgi:endothelin-converting enzyme/putative endopeptidase
MRWSLLNRASSQLSTTIEEANFDFYGKTLTGAVKLRPSDEKALQVINGRIGEALGKLYVEKSFRLRPKSKRRR